MARRTYKKYGVTVADASRPRDVDIQRQDINKAVPADDRACAMAQSLRRQPDIEGVSVGAAFVYVKYFGKRIVERFALKAEDRKMIHAFDDPKTHHYFRPCTVTLLPPSPSVKIGARTGQPSGTNTRKGKASTALNRTPPTRHVRAPG